VYTYLAAVDGIAVRNAGRREYIQRDREILALQNNLRDGRITIREFLMAAAHHFEPLEQEYGEVDVEVLNRPQNEIRAAFEALLVAVAEEQEAPHLPAAVAAQVPAAAAAQVPAAVAAQVPAAVAAQVPAAAAAQVPAAAAAQQAEPVPAAVAAQEQAERVPAAVVAQPAVPVPAAVAGQHQAEPVPAAVAAQLEAEPIEAAVMAEAPNRVIDDHIIAAPEDALRPAVGRRRQRGRPRGRRMAPRADDIDREIEENVRGRGRGDGRGRGRGRPRIHAQNEDNVRGRNVQRGRLRIRPMPPHHADPNLDSDDSGEDDRRIEDNRRIEQFFAIQEQRFLDRWDNFLARFHQRQMRALEDDVEIVDVQPEVVEIAPIGEQRGAMDVQLAVARIAAIGEQRGAMDVQPAVAGIAAIGEQRGAMDVEPPEIVVLRDDLNDGQRNAQQVMEGRVEEENGGQNPQPNFFQVDHDGRCAVCWERVPNQIINPCRHSFCLQCIQTLEASGNMRCPLCRAVFFNREPVIFPIN
jgi:hypothetical protein